MRSPNPVRGQDQAVRTNAAGARRSTGRRRGSAVMLVVVSLVMMVLIGAAYLQSVRVQRFAIAQVKGDMNAVIRSIINQIATTLAQDLEDDGSGKFELYDYPWTNDAADWDPEPLKFDGSSFASRPKGGTQDDAWLASSMPDFSDAVSTNWFWPHLTNLTGILLEYDKANNNFNLDADNIPAEHAIDFSGSDPLRRDTGVDLDANHLTDADGDGIPDSFWTWAPIVQVGGVTYVMAVRIEDLSAKVNINTAMSLGRGGGSAYVLDATPAGSDAPYWHTPTEVDLGRFVYDFNGSMSELRALLGYRLNTTVTDELISGTRRDSFWGNTGRMYPNEGNSATGRLFAIADEYELRYRNGLNNSSTQTQIEQEMPTFLRSTKSATTYDSADLTQYGGTSTPNEKDFFQLEPRHQMTTMSGAAVFAWPLPGDNFKPNSDDHFKLDLNKAKVDDIATRISQVYSAGSPTLPSGIGDPDVFAAQLAVNIADYRDSDNQLTYFDADGTPGTGDEYYGLEALPFITEVYAQAKYQVTNVASAGDTDGSGVDDYNLEWTRQGNAGYAIEIRNPFPYPISLKNIHLYVDDGTTAVEWAATGDQNGDTVVDLSDLISEVTGSPKDQLNAKEVLILYRHSQETGGVPADATNDTIAEDAANGLVQEETATGSSYTYVHLDKDWPDASDSTNITTFNGSTVTVELQVDSLQTNGITPGPRIAYSRAESRSAPSPYTELVIDPNPVPVAGAQDYWQRGSVGNGNGLNMLATRASDFIPHEDAPKLTGTGTRDTTGYERLGEADKTSLVRTDPLDSTIGNQILIRNGDFMHVGELAHIAVLGPTGPTNAKTIPEAWNQSPTPGDVRSFMLSFTASSTNSVSTTPGDKSNYDIPHAAFLIDQFTTLSPREDGVNNDNRNGPDDDGENIIPGLVNLNTMPYELLVKVLPIPDPDLRAEVAARIVAYRESDAAQRASFPGYSSGIARANPGIAYTGELFGIFSDLFTGDGSDTYQLTQDDGTPVRIDFLNDPTDSTVTSDGVADDREEEAMIAKWLAQVGSVRSDYYAAYVVVRGYHGGFERDNIIEAARFIAVFKRNAENGQVVVKMVSPRPYMVQ